jgi:hypothetical protein
MQRRWYAIALLASLAGPVAGHVIPVDPSTCAFDPVVIEAPAAGLTASGVPATDGDRFTITYDVGSSTAQFNAATIPPRAFSAPGVAGTLAVPTIFPAVMLKSGDLVTPSLPLTVAVGGDTVTLPLALSTGLAVASDVTREGSPMDAAGRFTLVGVAPIGALPPPFAGSAVVISLGCAATPRPDLDQFAFPQTKLLSATISAKELRLRAIFALDPKQTPDFPGRPALFRAATAATTIAVANRPGLPRVKKLFLSRGDDGTLIAIAQIRRKPPTYLLGVTVPGPAMPALARTTEVVFTYEVGGQPARVPARLRANRRGTRLRFP